jgi:ABC-type uncharacterized transport system substrate-binding protein
MWFAVKRLSLGVVLIGLAAATLLFSDWNQRNSGAGRLPRVAVFQLASVTAHDDTVRGIDDALRQAGFVDGQNIRLSHFNALGDIATANAIAKQLTGGEYDIVITGTTPLLQAVANNNKNGKTIHVFGLVADPFVAGVGLNRDRPDDHPAHLTGIGTFLPVEESFRLARKFFPALKLLGIVWNPAEANSAAYLKRARAAGIDQGIGILEAPVDNSAAVLEAAQSLVARGAQAFWIGGDSTVNVAIDSMIRLAKEVRIPVITIVPADPRRGTLFDLGADFYQVGHRTGELAVQILRGTDAKTIPIENYTPKSLVVNQLALSGLKNGWRMPEGLRETAEIFVDALGVHKKKIATAAKSDSGAAKALPRKWKIDIIEYITTIESEEGEKGILAGLREAGLVEGRDYDVTIRNAQGDMATVSALVDAAITNGAELLITVTTPALQAAIRRGGRTPIVFTVVSDAIAAGAGRTDTDHLPNVTGIHYKGAYPEMLALVREFFPKVRVLGTLVVPAEVNMVREKERLEQAAKTVGMEIIAVPVNSGAEVADAVLSLTSRKLDAIFHLPGNLVSAGFPSVVAAARKAKLPILAFQSQPARDGAVLSLARDYYDSGREAGLVAARVMRGESPASIPFRLYDKNKLMVNVKAARDIDLVLPPALVKKAEEVIGQFHGN